MKSPESIAENFNKFYSANGEGDDYPTALFSGLTLGVVVDTDDPLQGGRLRIFCPALNDNPKKPQHLPWANYISPFGGIINNSQYYRGTDKDNATSEGSVHYGFWAIPEMGAHVLVGCIDGDPRRRFWIGCMPEHQQTNTQFHGRYRWDKGKVEGPLTNSGQPIQPLYDNLKKAFNNENDSPEFRSRAADYQPSANDENVGQVPNSKLKESLDQQNEQIRANDPDTWEHAALGAQGYDWSGFKQLGAIMSSRVYGMSTPGMHAFTMDDRPFNSRMRLRTTSGHQILMDDTNERIYVSTYDGNNYIEMDANGNIDVYSKTRMSFHAENDINFTTEKTFRIKAKEGIHLYAGEGMVDHDADSYNNDTDLTQTPLEFPPMLGEIRIHSQADLTLKSEENIRQHSLQDTYQEANGNFYGKTDKSFFQQTKENMNISTDEGAYNMSIATDISETAGGNSKRFSEGSSSVASKQQNEVVSLQATTDVAALTGVNMKTSTGNVSIESQGNGGAGGNVDIRTPSNQVLVGDDGVKVSCGNAINIEAAFGIMFSVDPAVEGKLKSPVPTAGIPNNIGQGPNPSLPPSSIGFIPWDDYSNPAAPPTINTCRQTITIDEMVQIAYAAGFRGRDLVVAVAVAIAESGLHVLRTNSATGGIFADVVGLYQIRTFANPDLCHATPWRDNTNRQLENPNTNTQAAYSIFTQEEPKNVWAPTKWPSIADGRVNDYLDVAEDAVERWSNSYVTPSTDVVNNVNDLYSDFQNAFAQLNAILNPSALVSRLLGEISEFTTRIQQIQTVLSGNLPVSGLLSRLGVDLTPFQNQVLSVLGSVGQGGLPALAVGALSGLSNQITSFGNVMSRVPKIPGISGTSSISLNGTAVDIQSMADINFRSITLPVLNTSQFSMATQFNVTVAAVTAIINYLPISPPVPTIPIGPTTQLLKTYLPSVSLPPLDSKMATQILKNNSFPAAKQALAAEAQLKADDYQKQLKGFVESQVKAITG